MSDDDKYWCDMEKWKVRLLEGVKNFILCGAI